MGTETYNPQERTFIKKPETKTCITCGQVIPGDVVPLKNEMNQFLNPLSGKTVVINSPENTIKVQDVTLYRVNAQTGKTFVPIPESKPEAPTSATPSVPTSAPAPKA